MGIDTAIDEHIRLAKEHIHEIYYLATTEPGPTRQDQLAAEQMAHLADSAIHNLDWVRKYDRIRSRWSRFGK